MTWEDSTTLFLEKEMQPAEGDTSTSSPQKLTLIPNHSLDHFTFIWCSEVKTVMAGCCPCVLSPVSVTCEMFTGNCKQERTRKKTAQLHWEGDKKSCRKPNNQDQKRKMTSCLVQCETDVTAVMFLLFTKMCLVFGTESLVGCNLVNPPT